MGVRGVSIADFIESMAAAGAPIEAIILAVRTIEGKEAEIESRRAKDAERKRRQRDRDRDSHDDVTGQSSDSHGDSPLPPPPLSPQTPHTPPPPPPLALTQRADAHTREGWDDIRDRYFNAIAEIFGPELRPGWPSATDRTHVLRWLEAGATPQLIADVTRDHLGRMKVRGRNPPKTMSCFEDAIAAAIAAANRPMPEIAENARPSPPASPSYQPAHRNRAGTEQEHRAALAAAVARRLGHQPPGASGDRPEGDFPGHGDL